MQICLPIRISTVAWKDLHNFYLPNYSWFLPFNLLCSWVHMLTSQIAGRGGLGGSEKLPCWKKVPQFYHSQVQIFSCKNLLAFTDKL